MVLHSGGIIVINRIEGIISNRHEAKNDFTTLLLNTMNHPVIYFLLDIVMFLSVYLDYYYHQSTMQAS